MTTDTATANASGAATAAAADAANAAAANLTDPAAPPAATPPAVPTAPATGVDSTGKPWTVDSALAELQRVRDEAAKKRTASKNVVDALRAVATEVGMELPDGEPTVEGLSSTVNTITEERDTARADAANALKERIYAEEAWKAGIPADRATYLAFLLSQNPAIGGTTVDASSLEVFRGTVHSTITALRGSDPVLQAAGGGQGASGPDAFGGANGTTAVTAEQFEAMSYDERLALYQKNPEEYRRLANR